MWFIALIFLALISCAHAQVPMTGAGLGAPAVAAGYTGPGDVLASNWKMFWGFRAFTSATRGNKLANICNSTGGIDVLCQDFSSDATTGLMVVTTIGGVTCTTNCTVKTLYDISGQTNCTGSVACDMTNSTVATRPVLVPACLNGDACMSCNGSTQLLSTVANTPAQAQPFSETMIAERTGNTSAFNTVFSSDSGGVVQTGFSTSVNSALIYALTVVSVSSVNDNVVHAINVAYNGTSTIYNIDAATGTVNPGAGTFPGGAVSALCANVPSGNNFQGNFWEAGLQTGANSSGNLSSMNTNQHAAYGGF